MKMTKDEIIEKLADFALLSDIPRFIELRDAARELLKPEPDYRSWLGSLVYVKGTSDSDWHGPYILQSYLSLRCATHPFKANDEYWQECKPYDGKLKLIPIIHDGSDKCPVDPDETVLGKYRPWENAVLLRGEDHRWPKVESYVRIEILGEIER